MNNDEKKMFNTVESEKKISAADINPYSREICNQLTRKSMILRKNIDGQIFFISKRSR